MEAISTRHAGDAGGLLAPMDASALVTVGIEVAAASATLPSTQHTAWMLVNLLSRFEDVIARIDVACPVVPLLSRVVPGARGDQELGSALASGANAVQAVPARAIPAPLQEAVDIHFVVGPGEAVDGAIRVFGDGWIGAISPFALPVGDNSDLPFGPYVAACLAAAHVFLTVRALTPPVVSTIAYSVWSFTPGTAQFRDGPRTLPEINVDAALAGVGAVGSSWVHALWAVAGLRGSVTLADSDPEGVSRSNLNRCPLFTNASIGHPKADEAARICSTDDLSFVPHKARLQDLGTRPAFIISAVDTNTARAAIQALYPSRLLSASTSDLRAELLRCDPSAGAPCLRCFNPPEPQVSDDKLRRAFREATPDVQVAMARDLDISLDDALRWAIHGVCGYASDRLIVHLRASTVSSTNAFAVGFVSVLAGTMLAAQTVKELMGTAHPFNAVTCRAVFQFLNPSSERNVPTPYHRDEGCAMCDPLTPAGQIWLDRYARGLQTN